MAAATSDILGRCVPISMASATGKVLDTYVAAAKDEDLDTGEAAANSEIKGAESMQGGFSYSRKTK